jgi:thiol-disulfide isomerase/thioredoxin
VKAAKESLRYRLTFSPTDSADMSSGIADLVTQGNTITGTILTESGDYRYLEGEINEPAFWLSAFDGTHLFYLSGEMHGDSITNGVFLSGKHWQEPWVGVKDNTFSLRDPYTITQCNINQNPTFTVADESRQSITFDSSNWQGHISIIQIMGSWCPNCTDESRFFKSLYEKHNTAGMQIIPLAFERGDDVKAACERVRKQFNQLGLPYPFYYGGKSGRSDALQTLTFLKEVNSFPTSIFIDKKGNIRRVYTGFYGPGTRQEYTKHCASISALVDSLIAE